MKRIILLLWVGLLLNNTAIFAGTGNLFNVTSSGGTLAQTVSFTLCLDISGKSPLSCQQYTTQQATLSIFTTIPNHTYYTAGIKINTPGYTVGSITSSNGYANIGVVSNTQAASVAVSGSMLGYTVTPTGDGNESITPSTPQTVNENATQSFSVTANAGYTLSNTVGGTCPAGSWSSSTYTTGPITASCDVSFSATSATVSAVAVGYYRPSGTTNEPISYYLSDINNAATAADWVPTTTFTGAPTGTSLQAVDCGTSAGYPNCMTIGTTGNTTPYGASSTDGGQTWTTSSTLATPSNTTSLTMSGISCAGSSNQSCAAVAHYITSSSSPSCQSGCGLIYYTGNQGSTWTTIAGFTSVPNGFKSISCQGSNANTCVALGNVSAGPQPIAYYTTDASSGNISDWQQSTFNSVPSSSYLVSVSCTGSTCVAVGYGGTPHLLPQGFYSTDTGSTWNPISGFPTGSSINMFLESVSCNSSSGNVYCMAVGYESSSPNVAIAYYLTYSGGVWTVSTTLTPETGTSITNVALLSVRCSDATSQNCIAVGFYNSSPTVPIVFVTTNGGTNWASVQVTDESAGRNSVLNGIANASGG